MFFIKLSDEVVSGLDVVEMQKLKCHEHVVHQRLDAFKSYLSSLEGDILISSIIVCNKTNTIIDGHHRYHALMQLGVKKIPVTYINYDSQAIKAYFDDRISKNEILDAAKSEELLPPKSSKHVIYDANSHEYKPILLLSSIFYFNLNSL